MRVWMGFSHEHTCHCSGRRRRTRGFRDALGELRLPGAWSPLMFKVNEHNLGLRYGLTGKEFDDVWRAFHEEQWARLPLYDHAHDLVYSLEDMGCEIWAVTSINPDFTESRAVSLDGFIPAGRILCVGYNAPAMAKVQAIRQLGAVAFLDDHPVNINSAVGHTLLPTLLYQGVETPEPDMVTVIDDAMDFPVLVEEMLRRTGRMVA